MGGFVKALLALTALGLSFDQPVRGFSSVRHPVSGGAWSTRTFSAHLSRQAISGDEGSDKEEDECELAPGEIRDKHVTPKVDDFLSQVHSGQAWTLPNPFEIFLNQCCIQSFMFLVKSMRDPHTVLWVEDFTQPAIPAYDRPAAADMSQGASAGSKLLSYHGLAGINMTAFPTWSSYFSTLLEQPKTTYLIESGLKYVPNYELEINPPSLCSRILSVREQIAREFSKDLEVISTMGAYTLESYWNGIRQQKSEMDPLRQATGSPNLLFLENNANEDSDYAPSPLRKGNFDLLLLLATQESIHRVLNDPEGNAAIVQYLQNFYVQRLPTHFTGRQRYGQAGAFLDQLLSQPPSIVQQQPGSSSTVLIDPIRLAEMVLAAREKVALEWKELVVQVPVAHMEIKRQQLNLLMGIVAPPAVVKGME
jgi:hypothetical protein